MAYENGGRADKYGNRFETNWTIRKLLEVIEEKIESVTIEAIGDDEKGADLWITYKDGIRESQQCKGRNGSFEYWDYGTINSKNIWKTWAYQLERSSSITVSLVSPLNCTLLEDIGNRARTNGQDPNIFYKEQILKSSTDTRRFFNNACEALGLDIKHEEDIGRALSFFSRIFMRQVTDGEMKNEILAKISSLFIGNPETVYRIFIDYILNEDVYGKALDISVLGSFLKTQNVEYRNLANDTRIWPTVIRLNEEYGQVFKPFSCGFVEREETEKCLELIREGISVVIHGNAGIGKSGCTENLISRLKKENITYLAIKLDRNIPVGNSEMWAKELGFPASISYCINAVAPNDSAVLILDQLDALRWTQAHSSDALTICTQVINEIRQLNKERKHPISLVFVCRTYDLNNDSFISSLFVNEEEWKKIPIGELSDSALKKVLGESFDGISSRTRNLLRIPSNLYIWEKLEAGQGKDDFAATHQLIREWWKQITYVAHFKNLDSNSLDSYRNGLIKYCYENSKLNMPSFLLNIPGDYEEFLVSSGFIVVENNLVAFVHQSILDCFFAEEMLREFSSGKNIVEIVGKKENQTPSKRYQFVIFMQQLAEFSEQDFVKTGLELIANVDVRYSFKYVFIEVLSQMPCSQNVKTCVCDLFKKSKWMDCVINTIIMGSPDYVHMLRDNGELSVMTQTREGVTIAVNLFHSIRTHIDNADIEIIKSSITEENAKEWSWIFSGDIDEDTAPLFELRLYVYDAYPSLLNHYLNLKKLMQKCEKRAICIYTRMLKEKIHRQDNSLYRNADEILCSEMDLSIQDYKYVIDSFIPLFPKVSEQIRFSDWSQRHALHNGLERTCVLLVKLASEAFVAADPDGFIEYYRFAYDKGNFLYNEIVLDALSHIDEEYADYVLDYISRNGFVNAIEDSSGNGNKLTLAKVLISRFTDLCSNEKLSEFENRVICYNSSKSKDYLKHRMEFNSEQKAKKERSVYWPFWGDLQFELLPVISKKRRSQRANDLLCVLERRYENYASEYDYEESSQACSVVSPVSGKKLSVNNWLGIINNNKIASINKAKWKQKDGICIESSLMEFSYAFSKFVSENPRETASALLSIDGTGIHESFIAAFFSGVATSNSADKISEDLLAEIIQKYGYDYKSNRAANIAYAIEKVTIIKKMDYFASVLLDIIQKHTNPKEGEQIIISNDDKDGTTVSSIESNAINCVRGGAIKAFSSLVWENKDVYVKNKVAIELLTEDKNIYVAYATLFLLWPIINYDHEWAEEKIINLFNWDYRLAGFADSRRFFCICKQKYPDNIVSIIGKMFCSNDERLIRIAGYSMVELNMIADFFPDIFSAYVSSTKGHRKPMLEMTITYFGIPQYRGKAKDLLEKIIQVEDDEDNEFLWGRLFTDKLVDITQDRALIDNILKSKIKKSVLSHFYEYVVEQNMLKQYADLIFDLCMSVLEKPDEEKYIWGVDTALLKMVLGLYDETANSENPTDIDISLKCLDVWDIMYEKNVGMARSLTEQLQNV